MGRGPPPHFRKRGTKKGSPVCDQKKSRPEIWADHGGPLKEGCQGKVLNIGGGFNRPETGFKKCELRKWLGVRCKLGKKRNKPKKRDSWGTMRKKSA